MPSELDLQLNAIMDALTAPGAMLETTRFTRSGVDYPVLKMAPESLPALFAQFCAQHGDAEFLVDGEERLTFREAYVLAESVASGLVTRHGLRKGERVGIAARNSANWVIVWMGVLMAGGVAALLNGWWTGEELADGVRLVDCPLVIADPERAERLAGQDHAARVLVFRHGAPGPGLAVLVAEPTRLPDMSGDDLATILYTSGSTGAAKGAVSDHRGVIHGALSYAAQSLMVLTWFARFDKPPAGQQSALVNVPLFHVTGEIPVLLQSFIIGRKLVMLPKWDAVEAMRLIEAERITYFVGVPLMSYEIATHPQRHRFDLSSCQTWAAGGAPRPADHVARIREGLPDGYPILGYGLTETNAVGCGNVNGNYLAKPGSTGPVSRPLVDVAVFDSTGQPVAQGETGEVAIRSVANIIGYWQNPQATAEALRPDGYFLTGDLGYLDADGYLFIVDRKKDVIIRGGENIACPEVEAAIYAHPAIAEATVFGLPDARLGEVPVAVYHLRPGEALCEDGLRAFVAAHLAPFKVPVRFFAEAAPLLRLGTEKVDKRAVKARYAAAWNDRAAGG